MPEEKNIAELARETASDISSIARNEVRLAAAEFQDNMEKATKGLAEAAAGAALLIPAATVALVGAGVGLGAIDGIADWAGLLIVAAVAGVGGLILMKSGKQSFDPSKFMPKKTVRNLRRDAQTLKEATQ